MTNRPWSAIERHHSAGIKLGASVAVHVQR